MLSKLFLLALAAVLGAAHGTANCQGTMPPIPASCVNKAAACEGGNYTNKGVTQNCKYLATSTLCTGHLFDHPAGPTCHWNANLGNTIPTCANGGVDNACEPGVILSYQLDCTASTLAHSFTVRTPMAHSMLSMD